MKTIRNVLYAIVVSISLSACATTLDILSDYNETDENWYDKTKCEHGNPSEPGAPRRPGCVNSQTWAENAEELGKYKIERKIYLEEADNSSKNSVDQ